MQKLKDNVKNKIIDNARKLFFKNGYHNTTMRQIAVASRITVGNIYRYFANKKVLFNYIVNEAYQELVLLMDDASSPEQLEIIDPKYFEYILEKFVVICKKYRKELVILIRRYLDEGQYPLFKKLEVLIEKKILEGAPSTHEAMIPTLNYVTIHAVLYTLQTSTNHELGQKFKFLFTFIFDDMEKRVAKI